MAAADAEATAMEKDAAIAYDTRVSAAGLKEAVLREVDRLTADLAAAVRTAGRGPSSGGPTGSGGL